MYSVIPPSHLFGISRNQAEPAGKKIFQNSRHIREGISNPSHTRGGMSRNDVEMEIIYIPGYAIRRCSELRPDSFEGQSKDSDDIWIAFQLNSFNIEIDSGSNRNAFDVHSGSIAEAQSGHSGRILSGLPCRFSFEGDQNVSNVVGMP